MNTSFINWLNTFIQEKDLSSEIFEIEHNGNTHFVESEVILDLIKVTSPKDQAAIKNILVQIDFKNGDINDFLKHLAKGYVETNF